MKTLFAKKFKELLESSGFFWVLLSSTLLLTIILGFQFGKLNTSYSIDQFQPQNHEELKRADETRELFLISETSPIVIGLTLPMSQKWTDASHLKQLSQLVEEFESHESIEYVTSLTNLPVVILSDDQFQVGSLSDLGESSEVYSNPTVVPQFLSKDGRSVSLILQTEALTHSSRAAFMAELNSRVDDLKSKIDDLQTHIGGAPAVASEVTGLLNKEITLYTLLSLILAALVILLVFRNLYGPFVCVGLIGIINVFCLSTMNILELPFTVLSNTVPVLIAINVISVFSHSFMAYRRFDKIKQKGSRVVETYGQIWKPQVLSALTTAIGFATLIPSDVPIIRDFGIAVVLSIAISTTFMLIVLPHLIYRLPEPRLRNFGNIKINIYQRMNPHPKLLAGIFTLIVVGGFLLWKPLNWSSLLFDDLPESNPTRQASQFVDERLGGTLPLDIRIASKQPEYWLEPSNLQKLSGVLAKIRKDDNVGSALAMSEFIRMASVSGEIPANKKQIKEKLFLYGTSEENPLDYYMTPNQMESRISILFKDRESSEIQESVNAILGFAQNAFPGEKISISGNAWSAHLINKEISSRLIYGFFTALLFIFMVILLQFRSLSWSLLATMPNLLPPLALVAVLVGLQVPIKPSIAMVFSISLGIAFDNTIYILSSLKKSLAENRTLTNFEVVQREFYAVMPACLLSGLCTLAGFSIFIFSYFYMSQLFGFFMMLTILSGLVGDLLLLPVFLLSFPKVLDSKIYIRMIRKVTSYAT